MTEHATIAEVEDALAGLAEPAPAGLAGRVLAAVGLADRVTLVDGPLGPLRILFTDRGVSGVVPDERWEEYVAHRATRPFAEVAALPPGLARQVARALASGRLGNLPVDLSGLSEFQQAVLRKTAEIPPGELRPYGWVAREIGARGAVRAVGSALNRNPVPILVPCHRVSRSDGHIGGYGYGPEMKRALLAAEGLDPDMVEDWAARRVRYVGNQTTGIFCLPTCRHAKRSSDTNLVEFVDRRQAESAGYRGCKVCRPAA